ncbi:hypothetical protein GGQ97_002331 [Sphingomonas kaistensis]|uniref:Uncharacterized protein n=1 Tax=Sphingomonas kaistensis TaxID=298708 RepID=A0A7X5Y7B1_9SPHN|nr:hypothetical protein [Sphingomonas kaistensis]NJC06538.1 hypothetical protein [Sphingomonas kaistensis]
MPDRRVIPPVKPLTEQEARHLLAGGLLKPCHDSGPTRVGLTIGCDEKTVRKARDEVATMRLDLSWNALLVNENALDGLAAHFGKKLVDTNAGEISRKTASCITKLMFELSVALEDDRVDDRELAAMRHSIEEVGKSIDAMRERLSLRAAA